MTVNHPGRYLTPDICRSCRKPFHALYKSKRLYCSPRCVGQGNSERARRFRTARAAAVAGTMTDAQIVAYLRDLPPFDGDQDDEKAVVV